MPPSEKRPATKSLNNERTNTVEKSVCPKKSAEFRMRSLARVEPGGTGTGRLRRKSAHLTTRAPGDPADSAGNSVEGRDLREGLST